MEPRSNPHAVGFDQTTLRPTVDVRSATARIHALAGTRTLAGLTERAQLLEAVGRVDEAAHVAAGALVVARATGSRETAANARLLRASVALARGKGAEAVRECTRIVEEARAADWVETWGRALQQRGIARFSLEEWAGAADDFRRALELRRESEQDAALIAESELTLLVAQDRLESEERTPRRRAHPLFGHR